jgi:hypothetical protein
MTSCILLIDETPGVAANESLELIGILNEDLVIRETAQISSQHLKVQENQPNPIVLRASGLLYQKLLSELGKLLGRVT